MKRGNAFWERFAEHVQLDGDAGTDLEVENDVWFGSWMKKRV